MLIRYHWYLEIFKQSKGQFLDPRRKYDFRVELMSGVHPQESRVIPLFPAMKNSLNNILKSGLAIGTIMFTTSVVESPVFFTGKKDSNLRSFFDCRTFNTITVTDEYQLLLEMGLIESLLHANIYTQLDIHDI